MIEVRNSDLHKERVLEKEYMEVKYSIFLTLNWSNKLVFKIIATMLFGDYSFRISNMNGSNGIRGTREEVRILLQNTCTTHEAVWKRTYISCKYVFQTLSQPQKLLKEV